ncbi:uncharacterized protein LOC127846551 isoform X2 [Dreissena polymorpha]|uniref:uncharacterized protein LOC127846551 isoform X2 n=1 Tax=Dreissena polymorpha TaxID=45954 RepID=UPI002264A347|nr:uncharacterized protein LOC127846551 isoform X2 [Dreissena polymorpha]
MLNIRKEFIVKHVYVFMFHTLASFVLVICSLLYTKHIEEHNRTCLFEEVELQCTTLSNLLQQQNQLTETSNQQYRYPEQAETEARLTTFEYFPNRFPINVDDLAQAGLFYTGEAHVPDDAMCDVIMCTQTEEETPLHDSIESMSRINAIIADDVHQIKRHVLSAKGK